MFQFPLTIRMDVRTCVCFNLSTYTYCNRIDFLFGWHKMKGTSKHVKSCFKALWEKFIQNIKMWIENNHHMRDFYTCLFSTYRNSWFWILSSLISKFWFCFNQNNFYAFCALFSTGKSGCFQKCFFCKWKKVNNISRNNNNDICRVVVYQLLKLAFQII